MLIAHISDSHLGASPYGLPEREKDFYEAFEEAIEIIIKEHVDAVVHSGDLFDVPRPPGQALLEFLDGLKRLTNAGIKAFFTLGEHDISRIADRPSAFLFSTIGLADYIGDGVPREYNGITFIGFHKHRRTELTSLKGKLEAAGRAIKDRKGVLVLHQALLEFHRYAGEISEADLPSGFTYYAMGHLHDKGDKRLANGAIVAYPGSLEATSVEGIKDSEKGFYFVDLSKDEPSLQWVKLKSVRPRISYSLTYEELQNDVEQILNRITSLEKRPLVKVEVRVNGSEEEMARALVGKIARAALYCEPEITEVGEPSPITINRPADVTEEIYRIASQVLKNEEMAKFALEELLPRLSGGGSKEAADLMWELYTRRLKRADDQ